MSNKLIPYRSQSHDLNEFIRSTAARMDTLYSRYNTLAERVDLLAAMLKVQGMAAGQEIGALKAESAGPQMESSGTITHRLGATLFAPSGSAVILPGYEAGSMETISSKSCLIRRDADGGLIIPRSLSITTSPAVCDTITETDPLDALRETGVWWRKVVYRSGMAGAEADFVISLPTNILEDPSFNQIRLTPFPCTAVIRAVRYRRGGRWYELSSPKLGEMGGIIISVPPAAADAVSITVGQTMPVTIDGETCYHLGLAEIGVERVAVSDGEAVFSVPVALSGSGPWQLKQIAVDVANARVSAVEIETGGVRVSSLQLPYTTTDGSVIITIRVKPESINIRPLFYGATLTYTNS